MALVLSPPSACALEIMRQLTRLPDELTYNPVSQAGASTPTAAQPVSIRGMSSLRLPALVLAMGCLALPFACRRQPSRLTEAEYKPDPCSSRGEFFPPQGAIWSGEGLHYGEMQGHWEALFLTHMHEPSLFACSPRNSEASYRFLLDRSLNKPIATRLVVHGDGTGTLFVRVLENSGIPPPPPPGKSPISEDDWFHVESDRSLAVTSQQTSHALALFSQIGFWRDMQSALSETTDGSDWIFESKVQGKYRLIDFRNKPSPVAKAFGMYLVRDLAKLQLDPGEVY
jgi:hypothetical protein